MGYDPLGPKHIEPKCSMESRKIAMDFIAQIFSYRNSTHRKFYIVKKIYYIKILEAH